MIDQLDNDILNHLTQGELTVLKYIDAHTDEVLHMSIQQLATDAFTSTATILRLCKKMHLTGFSELKFVLRNQLSALNSVALPQTTAKMTVEDLYSCIENTSRFLDTKALLKAAKHLAGDSRIHLYAGGLTAMALEYMQRFLLSTGRTCVFYNTAPLAYRAAAKMDSRDFFLIASTSGATPSVIRTAQIAKNSGALIAAITNLGNTPLSRMADINFYTFIENRDYYGTDIKSRITIFYIVDMILECYLEYLDSPAVRILPD